jgi:aldehyde reductase
LVLIGLFQEGPEFVPTDPKTGLCIPSDVDYVDTWKAMEELLKKGLTRSLGVSNFNSKQIERLLKSTTIVPVTNQVRGGFSMLVYIYQYCLF